MIKFKKKLQGLKKEIRKWVTHFKSAQSSSTKDLKKKLLDIDKILDQGGVTDDVLFTRMEIMKQLHDLNSMNSIDFIQKAKVRWAIEGDENSKFFHGVINRKRNNLYVKGIMIDGAWVDDPSRVKEEFRSHFEDKFSDPDDEIRKAVWGCGENKSPGPDGFTFEFFRKFWGVLSPDFCTAVKWFFDHGVFATG
nr:RNA-directed DNA polymerase, eukaryota [Tanacetum cinerariifolium]